MKAELRYRLLPVILIAGLLLLIFSMYLLILSIGYMERGYVGTSLLTLLIGFSLLSSSLYLLRLSAHVYAIERKGEKE
jgi:uncharacterized membrane protein YgdD (TMEM256/DUF423 family)